MGKKLMLSPGGFSFGSHLRRAPASPPQEAASSGCADVFSGRMEKIIMRLRKTRLALLLTAAALSLSLTAGALEIVSVSVTPAESAPNTAPIAENLEYKTYRNVAIEGELSATDPDGDALSFRLGKQPKKGSLELKGSTFVYTPKKDKKGADSFTYTAVDSFGNSSEEATVTIRIEKQATELRYADLEGDPCHYAALRLAEKGVYLGEQLGGTAYFRPEESISRGEFLSMCLSAAGVELLQGVTRTGFSDDADIPDWEKSAVSTALMAGIVRGYAPGDGRVVFSANSAVTGAEALVMLSNTLRITDVTVPLAYEDAVPVWAAQATANCTACSLVETGLDLSAPLDRGQAAKLLSSAMDLLERRESRGFSLLGWAR